MRVLRQRFTDFKERVNNMVGEFLGMCFLLTLYFAAGLVIAAPYTFLAGGSRAEWVGTALVAPIAALFIFVVGGTFDRARSARDGRRRYGILGTMLMYACLPILFNGLSMLTAWMELERAARFLYSARYLSFLGVIAAFAAFAIIASIASDAYRAIRPNAGHGGPPAAPPPDGLGDDRPVIDVPVIRNDTLEFALS